MGHEEIDWSVEFQDRRRQTWENTRNWLVVAMGSAILGCAFGNVDDSSTRWKIAIAVILWTAFFSSMFVMTFWVRKLYRCPSCDEIPMGGSFSVGSDSSFGYEKNLLLNPKKCPHCGVMLKQ
jgi:FtsH-binding integral membrane protein